LVDGVAGGAAGAGIGGVLAPRLTPPVFPLVRILAWALLGAAIGLTLGMRWWQEDERRTADGAGYGALAGAGARLHHVASTRALTSASRASIAARITTWRMGMSLCWRRSSESSFCMHE
jgi:hypothetical protein